MLATLILIVAPTVDALAAAPMDLSAPASVEGARLLPAWLDVVEDPFDHLAKQAPGGHCGQVQLPTVLLPEATAALPALRQAAQAWSLSNSRSLASHLQPRLERPPRA